MMRKNRQLYQFLTTEGDGSGEYNFIGDYSTNPVCARIVKPRRHSLDINRLLIVALGQSGGWTNESYGGRLLTQGITLTVRDRDDCIVNDITGALPITTGFRWAQECYDVQVSTWGLNRHDMLRARFSLGTIATTRPLRLNGRHGYYQLCVQLRDDMRHLLSHTFKVNGLVT